MKKLFIFFILVITTFNSYSQVPGIHGNKNLIHFDYRLSFAALYENMLNKTNDGINSIESFYPKFNTFTLGYSRIVGRRSSIGGDYSFNFGKIDMTDGEIFSYKGVYVNDPKIYLNQFNFTFKFFGRKKIYGLGFYGKITIGYFLTSVIDVMYLRPGAIVDNVTLVDYDNIDIRLNASGFHFKFGAGYSWVLSNNLLFNIEASAGYGTKIRQNSFHPAELKKVISRARDTYINRLFSVDASIGVSYLF